MAYGDYNGPDKGLKDHDGREEQRSLFGFGPRHKRPPNDRVIQLEPVPTFTSEKPLTKRQKRRQRGNR